MSSESRAPELREWLKEGAHLPSPLRDFHDQKDVFKSLHDWAGKEAGVSWVVGHIYVIDLFLRFMATHGWTLQRSRARLPFADLATTIDERREREASLFKAAFANRKRETVNV
jgi:hypothetical protein